MYLEDFVKLKASLVMDEGSTLKMYLDPLGVPTIGVGHNLNSGLSQQIIDLIFDADVISALLQLTNLPQWAVTDSVRQAVLLNMAFQLGVSGLLSFNKMWAALAKKDYKTAAAEMLNSKWHTQTPARAERLAKQMETGLWA